MKRQFEATLHRVLDELETLGFPLPAQGALCSRSGVCSALKEAGGRDSISQSWSMAWGELGLSLHCRLLGKRGGKSLGPTVNLGWQQKTNLHDRKGKTKSAGNVGV
jgi:hypothetical protein